MKKCEHCASRDVRWFTPPRNVDGAAVLLCMGCHRLTIVPPHQRTFRVVHETSRAA
jgi:hypothetical protein